MSLVIHDELVSAGHPNRPGTKLEGVRAFVFHYTANDRPSADDTMNARYFGRKWLGTPNVPLEADGKTPFRYGATQLIADMDSVTRAVPCDEVTWACGDRPLPYTDEFRGQAPAATYLFGRRQNFLTVNIEICSNDIIKDSDEDWQGACSMAAKAAIDYIRAHKLDVNLQKSLKPNDPASRPSYGEILLLRHYDVTGKVCPKPMVDDPKAWVDFITMIAAAI